MTRPFTSILNGATCLSLLNDMYEFFQSGGFGITFDTDTTLAANSDTRVATQKAIKAYADALIAANDAMVFKGVIDCSANPNYPAADRGSTYRVSVAGKIGGASGVNVENGDMLICMTDATASGNQATVGAQWSIVQVNLDGALVSGGALGTPSSGTLTSCTGLPVASGISGLAAGIAAFLATPSSANLASALTDEDGTSTVVMSTHPVITNVEFNTCVYLPIAAPAALGAASTATAAQMIAGILNYTGAANTLTLATGTNIDSGVVSGLAVDHGFEFSVINTGSGTCTVTTNTGLTLVGAMTVAAAASGRFNARRTAANAYTIYRLA